MNSQRYLGPSLVAAGAIAVLAVLGVPVVAFLPFLVVLACPLMMVFMMRGMNHGGAGHAGASPGAHEDADEH